jgi:hypothetical protein
MPKIFTPEVFDRISDLVAQGVGAAEIAEKIGCTLNSLRVKCSQQGICLRRQSGHGSARPPQDRLTIKLPSDIAALLRQQAWKRSTSDRSFATALLAAVLRDNLCDAVIDQEPVDPDRASRRAAPGASAAGRPKLVAKR